MKFLVFLLILGNLIGYAWLNGYLGQPENPDAGRLAAQVAPEKIRIVSRGEAPATQRPEPDAASGERICRHWEALDPAAAGRLEKTLTEQFPAFRLTRRQTGGESKGWWVFIPPLPDRASAERKAADLRQLGISDYFVIQEAGSNQHAISLGVFSSEKAGNDRLTELKARGVRGMRVAARAAKPAQIALEARGPAAARTDLDTATSELAGVPAARDCP